jgi:outer membrane protein assembly factor BamB
VDVKVLVAALALVAVLPAGTSARTRHTSPGTTHVFAPVPYPGHPGGIAVDGRTVYVDTFNPIDRAGDDYDAIFTYDLNTGRLRADRPNPIKVPRVMSPTVMGLAAIALDAQGRLYVDDMNGRVIRVNPLTGAQTNYGTFPTSSSTSLTAMPDGLAFDRAGNLYVTDGSSPTIWRVPPRRPGRRRR